MNIKRLSTKILILIFLFGGGFLLGYAVLHWPSWEAYLVLGFLIVCFVVVGILWIRRVQYLKGIEEDYKLATKIRDTVKNFQLKNCTGCYFAIKTKIGTGEPCCTYSNSIDVTTSLKAEGFVGECKSRKEG